MNLEQIDTSTTAGKAEVMRLAAEGRRVAAPTRPGWMVSGSPWMEIPKGASTWDWRCSQYAIISEPVGPEELWAVVFRTHTINFDSRKDAEEAAGRNGATVVRYIRADLAGEKG